MRPHEYVCMRLLAFLQEVRRLKEGEFPYQHSLEALRDLEIAFQSHLDRIHGSIDSPSELDELCADAVLSLTRSLPYVGFILRSTNVRNAFEVYGPLLRLTRSLLGDETALHGTRPPWRLLLSSEWEDSPRVHTGVPGLPRFVMLGLPAPESSNPLVIPLIGHELGHPLWYRDQCGPRILGDVRDALFVAIRKSWSDYLLANNLSKDRAPTPEGIQDDVLVYDSWGYADEWSMKQAEEMFCDLVGLRLFGTSFLHAFAYFFAPNYTGVRSVSYPDFPIRSQCLTTAVARWYPDDKDVFDNYSSLFQSSLSPSLYPSYQFQLMIADEILPGILDKLIDLADGCVSRERVTLPSKAEAERIFARFAEYLVPGENIKSIADVLGAGWMALPRKDMWKDEFPTLKPEERERERLQVLHDLVLKTLEVYEVEQRLGNGT